MTARSMPRISRQILDEAAAWFVEFRVGDDDKSAHQQFGNWLRRSPEHIQAYLELTGVWTDLPTLAASLKPDVDQLIALARSSPDIAAIGRALPASKPESRSPRRLWIGAAVAAGLCGIVLSVLLVLHGERTYATETGEQRSVTLADGSTVDLNAQSRLLVSFSKHERTVRLLRGQALFRVAKDKTRPFVVHAESATVRAVGTLFDVDQLEHEAVVTVLEGRVLVAPDQLARRAASGAAADTATTLVQPSADTPLYVSAGEQVTVGASAATGPIHADVIAATSWTRRELTFDNTRLRDVVNDFNRFNARPIVIEDQRLSDLAITGVYSSTDPTSLLRFLRAQAGISVAETDSVIRISEKPAR